MNDGSTTVARFMIEITIRGRTHAAQFHITTLDHKKLTENLRSALANAVKDRPLQRY